MTDGLGEATVVVQLPPETARRAVLALAKRDRWRIVHDSDHHIVLVSSTWLGELGWKTFGGGPRNLAARATIDFEPNASGSVLLLTVTRDTGVADTAPARQYIQQVTAQLVHLLERLHDITETPEIAGARPSRAPLNSVALSVTFAIAAIPSAAIGAADVVVSSAAGDASNLAVGVALFAFSAFASAYFWRSARIASVTRRKSQRP